MVDRDRLPAAQVPAAPVQAEQHPAAQVCARLDPITLEVIRHRLLSIPEQLETNIVRTAYSPLIYEYKDFAVGLVDHEGRLI